MEYSEDDLLLISGIQHFVFCRRQWALIHIEQQWKENALTVGGMLIHERVHDAGTKELRGDILTVRGLQVRSTKLGITGTCDAVEFLADDFGVELHGRKGKWIPRPVEYKHGESKASDCDRLQAAAQALCLEEMFCCQLKEACLWYHKTRRRETFALTDELKNQTEDIIKEMYYYYRTGHTPAVKPSKSCLACSLKDLCLPKLMNRSEKQSVDDYITQRITESGDC